MTGDQLDGEFRARRIPRGGSLLILAAADALELIDRAQVEQLGILGIDAFLLHNDGIQPMMEHTLDLSGASPPGVDSWAEARRFIAQRSDSPMVYEVVLADRPHSAA